MLHWRALDTALISIAGPRDTQLSRKKPECWAQQIDIAVHNDTALIKPWPEQDTVLINTVGRNDTQQNKSARQHWAVPASMRVRSDMART
jgi:hypothetical protein